jgi:putative resolvase
VDRDSEPLGGGPVEAALFAGVLLPPWYAPSTLVPVVSHGPGLLVGMRRRFRYPPRPAGRKPVVADDGETTDDLVGDMVEVLTSFCARLDGRRGARNRALRALTAARQGA